MVTKLLERASNIAVLIAAILVSISILNGWKSGSSGLRTPAKTPNGQQLHLTGVNWGDHKITLVLALSNGCHFCAASAPFYHKLNTLQRARHDLQIVAVFPEAQSEAVAYLHSKDISADYILSEPLTQVMAEGTPTIYEVDRTGHIKQTWIGYLSEDGQRGLLDHLSSIT